MVNKTPVRKVTRGPRRSGEQIRSLLVDAGLAIVAQDGLANGAEHLTFKRVFDHLERTEQIRLTHASVIRRVFDSQEDYQTAVLKVIATRGAEDLTTAATSIVQEIIMKADLSTPELRRACLQEVVRVAGNTASETLRTSPMWRAWIGVWALSASGNKSTASEEIRDALSSTYEQIDQSALDFYSQALEIFGLKLRPGISVQSFTVAASSIIEGCSLRDLVDPSQVAPVELPTGPGGERQTWSLQSVALMALVDSLTERLDGDS
jgi:hypothetical protein